MFFLHALAHRRARLEAEGDEGGLAALPVVTCYERSSGPGGVWRSQDMLSNGEYVVEYDGGDGNEGGMKPTNMYDSLWTNAAKEAMEFFDYTYLEHFGASMPMFLPRKLALDYILKRCTRNNPSFFDVVQFNTSVENVTFDAVSSTFAVRVFDSKSGCTSVTVFDYVIWAGGNNGRRNIPPDVDQALKSGGFAGKIMHSSQVDTNFDRDVRHKNVIIVGDQHSAEDLALYAIKLGAQRVDIVSRGGRGVATDMGSWPDNKVTVVEGYLPTGVACGGRGVILSKVESSNPAFTENIDDQIALHSVDTVIYCTGYDCNFSMLDESLRPQSSRAQGAHVDKGWKMSENALSRDLGHVPLGSVSPEFAFLDQNFYRGRLRSNPSIFFMLESVHEEHLLALDVTAWLFLAQITGDLPLPADCEINQFNRETLIEAMDSPLLRRQVDPAYRAKWENTIRVDHWAEDRSDCRTRDMIWNLWDIQYRILARDALDSGYPLGIGSFDTLNERGQALVSFNMITDYARYELDEGSSENWDTFRDCDPSRCYSIFTGQRASPLKRQWLDLDGSELEEIVDGETGDGDGGTGITPEIFMADMAGPGSLSLQVGLQV